MEIVLIVLGVAVLLQSAAIHYLMEQAKQQAAARQLASHIFKALEVQMQAQCRVNLSHLDTVKSIHKTIGVHGSAILRLQAQDQQFLDLLVALNLIETHAQPLTVN